VTVYVLRDGVLVEKSTGRKHAGFSFPTPMLSRMEPFESPVTGKDITTWRERERDMAAAGCVDPRDLPRVPFEQREKDNARRQQVDAEQRD
jgi:hypothetical protein